jgi:Mn-dependent DtxR family transcriptional regulator
VKEVNKKKNKYWMEKINNYQDLPGKNDLIRLFLRKRLSVDQKIATIEAYGLQHSLSKLTLTRLKKFIYFLENREDQHSFDIPEEVERFIKK